MVSWDWRMRPFWNGGWIIATCDITAMMWLVQDMGNLSGELVGFIQINEKLRAIEWGYKYN